MRNEPNLKIEPFRVSTGRFQSTRADGNNGMFEVVYKTTTQRTILVVCASDNGGWDHVSVSLPHRCPTWEEMEFVRELFFKDDELVLQFSPPRQKKINQHEYCLHLWRSQIDMPTLPPSAMVGFDPQEGNLKNTEDVKFMMTLLLSYQTMTELQKCAKENKIEVEEWTERILDVWTGKVKENT